MWDSFHNKPRARDIAQHCDWCFSFDPKDAESESNVSYLPLFHSYKNYSENQTKVSTYGVVFFGTVHGDRTAVAAKVLDRCRVAKIKTYFFLFAQGSLMKKARSIQSYVTLKKSGFAISTRALKRSEVTELIKKSDVVLDIHHPAQEGLTMRTFEVLFAGRKLITTNQNVTKHEFYSPERIQVISRNNPDISADFIKAQCERMPNHLWEKFSIQSWAKQLLRI